MAATLLAVAPGAGLAATSTAEAVQFWILAAVAVVGALGVVSARKAVYSALCLAMTMIALAVLYIAQGAIFLGVGQIIVYTGAVMMLFLFVVMLVGVESRESLVERLRGHRVAALVAGIGFGVLLATGIGRAALPTFEGFGDGGPEVTGIAALIFERHVWAFELTGVLLIIATLGAMVLANRERFTGRRTQRELVEQRFLDWQSGAEVRVTPLPTAGVYARNNAADQPARLPDGTYSEESVSEVLRRRAEQDDDGRDRLDPGAGDGGSS